MIKADAWVLRPGPAGARPGPGELVRATVRLPEPREDEALVEAIMGSWEANMTHALQRSPVDICRQRQDPFAILGNIGIVRVLRPAVAGFSPKEGDLCLFLAFGRRDENGYAELIHGYDMPGTHGLLATRTVVPGDCLLPLPPDSRHPLASWAGYGRYFPAWDNWRVAKRCWRAQQREAEPSEHLIFGWGGGVALAELGLARREGFRTAMTASCDDRLRVIAEHGITPIDRRDYPGLACPAETGQEDEAARAHRRAERALLARLDTLSDGRGCAVVVDNLGGPLFPTTLRAAARLGVITTCGWKAGMRLEVGRAAECLRRHVHVHTHAWRHGDSATIRDFQESTGWLPEPWLTAHYEFDDIPQLARDHASGRAPSYFPTYTVNPL
ncbi:zinc-binding alcohol dehydrogenase family protein [Kitasatospora sp. NPDC059462]|uniref:zinc-binding alcohol dehydrogenase family protein n=1 Tax=Kitasatospora sp. NPDC059462 TaxID=3346841 RepID=UPI0036A7E35A